jgi:hypothetical protein
MDDPGEGVPQNATLSIGKGSADSPPAVPTLNYPHNACSRTLKNPKACLSELPDELLIYIFRCFNRLDNQRCLAHLSRTSKGLKLIADELLYGTIRIRARSVFLKISRTLRGNARLARSVKSITWRLAQNLENPECDLRDLLRVVRSIQSLTIGTMCGLISDTVWYRTMLRNFGLWNHANLTKIRILTEIGFVPLRYFLSLPFLETISCRLKNDTPSSSAAAWEPFVLKSKVRNLMIHDFNDYEIISQIVSSVMSLKHLGLHYWSSEHGFQSTGHVSWHPIAQALATHKDSMESLKIVHAGCVDFRALGSLQDFPKLKTLKISLETGRIPYLGKPSLAEMLPKKLRKLAIVVWPTWTSKMSAHFHCQELLALKEHSSLEFVKFDIRSQPVVPPTQLRFSTVVQTLQDAAIRVELWENGREELIPAVSSLRDWEDRLRFESFVNDSDDENEETTSQEEDSEIDQSDSFSDFGSYYDGEW